MGTKRTGGLYSILLVFKLINIIPDNFYLTSLNIKKPKNFVIEFSLANSVVRI